MEIYYENHLREKINFSEWPIAIEDVTPLFAKKWDYDSIEQKNQNRSGLQRFYRTSKTIKIKIQVFADSREEYERCMDDLLEITEMDILNKLPGKLYCNGYYLQCYVTADESQDYEENFHTVDTVIEIMSVNPHWTKESEYRFEIQKEISSDNKKYAYQYPYRYANGMNNMYIVNPHYVPSNFRMIIYGPVVNPQITIGGTPYLVNIVLEEGEYLEIDSRTETIVKVMRNGTRVNAFHNRAKGRAFFVKIPSGRNTITWPGNFAFDLIIFEERSEPKWNKSK